MPHSRKISRRHFLKAGAAAAATIAIVPRRVLGGQGYLAPSDTLTRAVVGVGGMGMGHLRYPGAVLRAVCDVDRKHLASALEQAGPGVAGYTDFREVLARPDIDVVHIATLFRVNTWFRFTDRFYGFGTDVKPVKKAVQNGLLGWPIRATVSATTGFDWKFYWSGLTYARPEPVPAELDYDFWLGPAPWKPYHPHRVHGTFRGYWDYDGGGLGDMGMHYLDPVQYLLGKDDTGPVEVFADCPQQHPDACGSWRRIELKYADGCVIVLDGENKDTRAPFLEGPKGKLYKGFESDIPNLRQALAALPDPEPQVTDFSEAVRTRTRFALNESNAHRSCTLVNLAKIAVQLGRPLRFDPATETFPGDEAANRLAGQPMRAPWHL